MAEKLNYRSSQIKAINITQERWIQIRCWEKKEHKRAKPTKAIYLFFAALPKVAKAEE